MKVIPGLVYLRLHEKTKLVLAKSMRESYDAVLRVVNRHFPETRGKVIEIKVDLDNTSVVITPEAWCYFSESRDGMTVQSYTIEIGAKHEEFPPTPSVASASATPPTAVNKLLIHIFYNDVQMQLKVSPTATPNRVLTAAASAFNIDDPRTIYLLHEGMNLKLRGNSLSQCGVEDGDELILLRQQLGGKPVIYLRAPRQLDVTVQLSLVPDWSFSALYPVAPVSKPKSPQLHQVVQWDVQTAMDGTMQDKCSGAQVSYLFWEATTNPPSGQISPPSSPTLRACEDFRPASAKDAFKTSDSVVLSVKDVPLYLDATLIELGLDTEARTSFITYWLPAILEHQHILLSFVPQASYDSAAPLSLTPSPDVLTRVFMIFCGLELDETAAWVGKAERPAEMWRGVSGVPEKHLQSDPSLFRVLEWGGMEVKS